MNLSVLVRPLATITLVLITSAISVAAQQPTGNSDIRSDNTNEGVSPAMNKNELIGAVADASGLSRSDATKAVEGVFDTITRSLSKGDEVRLVGFGTFSVARRKASTGRNPRTGAPMTIKASTQPKFKAGKGLKDSVN